MKAIAAGIVVWIGLFTNTIYLLVAAMLIAPFAGPAMNTSLTTASGDYDLVKSSVARYAVGLLALAAITFILSLVLQLNRVTNLMMSVGQLSTVAALLPAVTGAIGAVNLIEPERNSLVPGTAVGLLVAAALVFRLYGGLTPSGSRYPRGKPLYFILSLALSVAVTAVTPAPSLFLPGQIRRPLLRRSAGRFSRRAGESRGPRC